MRRRGNGSRSVSSALKRLVVPGLLLMSAYYALFGGGYSVFDLYMARGGVEEEQLRLEQARMEIDSLLLELDRLENDPATIERVAREEYGMVREGELLYRFTDAEDAGERKAPPAR